MYTKISKVVLVWAIALFASLAALSNFSDYDSNYKIISHVLKMDTTFPDNNSMWRAIDSTTIHHIIFCLIIFMEAVIALFCWVGGLRLYLSRMDSDRFNQAKGPAVIGLTMGVVLWFTGFMTIGGEWFMMWQSEVANGQQPAFRLVVIFSALLIYLVQSDSDQQA